MSNTATSSNETATAAAEAPAVNGVLDAADARFAAEKAAASTDTTQTAATDKTATDKAAADKVVADKAITDKAAADKVTADKATADKAAADKVEADRIAAMTPEEKAAHEKKVADEKAGAQPVDIAKIELPDGIKQNAETMQKFGEYAKANNLTQAQAQSLATMAAEITQRNAASQIEALKTASVEWQKQSAADKEFGGDKLDENLSIAKRAIDKFVSPDLRKLLGEFDPKLNPGGTGLGNHPEMIRAFLNIGKTISEDSVVTGGTGSNNAGRSAADILYGKTTK